MKKLAMSIVLVLSIIMLSSIVLADGVCLYQMPGEDMGCVRDGFRAWHQYQANPEDPACEGEPAYLVEEVADSSCSCGFTPWIDVTCASEGIMLQARSFTRNLPYCTGVLEQQIEDSSCNCVYSDWADSSCVSDGVISKTRTQLSNFEFCEGPYYFEMEHDLCNCASTEQSRTCVDEDSADVTYVWNYQYCGSSFHADVSDSSCACVYTPYVDSMCVADGIMKVVREQSTSFAYCTEPLESQMSNPQCDCISSEESRICKADGVADASFIWNYQYCGQGFHQDLADSTCACIYSPWTDNVCVADGIMNQARSQVSDFGYCTAPLSQNVEDPICGCASSESARVCSSDGYATVTFSWNYGYCGSEYTQTQMDLSCKCIYTPWQNVECVEFEQRGQTRHETSGYGYCNAPLYQVVYDPTCNKFGDNGIIGIGVIPENNCPTILEEDCSYMTGGQQGVDNRICYKVDTYADEQSSPWGKELQTGFNGRSYAFEGETIMFYVTVEDLDGVIQDCDKVGVTLDNGIDPIKAGCTLVAVDNNHPVGEFGDSSIGKFLCMYTVESAEDIQGEYWVSVQVADRTCSAEGGCSQKAAGVVRLYLNPEVSLTLESQDAFGFMYDAGGAIVDSPVPGMTVYSPYFKIENTADGASGLYMYLTMYGTDMMSPTEGAMCFNQFNGVTTNVLDIRNVEFKGSHLNAQQGWTTMYRGLENAGPVFQSIPEQNLLGVGDDFTMRLRLNIPSPCKGVYSNGGRIVFIGEVI